MTQQDHLQVYDLVLTTRSPLFVGSGQEYTKKEYLYNSRTNEVSFLDQRKLFDFLAEEGLVDAFEGFMLGPDSNLYLFLTKDCRIPPARLNALIRCRVSAAEALKEGEHPEGIRAFQRDAAGRVYVPGSSVKGALRTAWLLDAVLDDPGPHELSHSRRPNDRVPFPEAPYLNRLSLDGRKENTVNDIFRGVQVSDSLPVSDRVMMLAGKTDAMPDGGTHSINLCRECVAPGVPLRFKLTLDTSVLKDRITAQGLLRAINRWDAYYTETYLPAFVPPRDAVPQPPQNFLILGGGAGFFSKSLAYPYLGRERGRKWTAEEMTIKFPNKGKGRDNPHHERDVESYGISPHTAKYTRYRQRLYPYGVCEVSIR